jgi:hypothetical protein
MGIDLVSILPGYHATGLDETAGPTHMKTWPMPFSDHLVIHTGAATTQASATVWTMTGTLVHEAPISIINEQARLELGALRPGPYVLRVLLGGKEQRQVIVKE